MTLPVDYNSDDYQFYKTLHEDVQLQQNQYGKWDLQMKNGDYVNVTGKQSLYNAIIIAIMTRMGELHDNPLYNEFGCRIHELIKANKTNQVLYEVELFVNDTLESIMRIQEVEYVEVTESDTHGYHIEFSVTSITDEIIAGSVEV